MNKGNPSGTHPEVRQDCDRPPVAGRTLLPGNGLGVSTGLTPGHGQALLNDLVGTPRRNESTWRWSIILQQEQSNTFSNEAGKAHVRQAASFRLYFNEKGLSLPFRNKQLCAKQQFEVHPFVHKIAV